MDGSARASYQSRADLSAQGGAEEIEVVVEGARGNGNVV